MREETWRKLESRFADFPILKAGPAREKDVDGASDAIGKLFPVDYREFLLRYGGAIVGAYPVFGVKPVSPMGNMWSVVDVNNSYQTDAWPGTSDWLIFSRDHAGNPIGIGEGGEVFVSDHGEAYRLAESFEQFVVSCLSND